MTRRRSWLVPGVALAALGTLALGLFLVGTPGDARQVRLDVQRVRDLQAIGRAADLYWTRHRRLPASLDALQREPGLAVSLRDPESGAAYGYRPVGAIAYELCANFALRSDGSEPPGFWSHGAGRHCFEREAQQVR